MFQPRYEQDIATPNSIYVGSSKPHAMAERRTHSASSVAASRQRVQIPVSVGKLSLRLRLEDYYSVIAPEIIENKEEWHSKFELIYQKYGGTIEGEQKLSRSLAKKYGSTVPFITAAGVNDSDASNFNYKSDASARGHHNNALLTKPESWFELTSQETNSGIIDFTSNRFDPLAALHSDSLLMIPYQNLLQNVPVLDNISKARVLLPDYDPYRIDPVVRTTKGAARKTNAQFLSEASKGKVLPILQVIASKYQTGPLSLLYKCFFERKRIKVLVRYIDCIRGTLTGYIVGFDKHLNIILKDADEIYTPRYTHLHTSKALPHLADNLETTSDLLRKSKVDIEVQRRKALKDPKQIHVTRRHCKHIFVRGDSVVMVWETKDSN